MNICREEYGGQKEREKTKNGRRKGMKNKRRNAKNKGRQKNNVATFDIGWHFM